MNWFGTSLIGPQRVMLEGNFCILHTKQALSQQIICGEVSLKLGKIGHTPSMGYRVKGVFKSRAVLSLSRF